METKYYLAVFDSKNHAIYVHQLLRKKKIEGFELVSTPCKIKSGCSYSIKFSDFELHRVLTEEAASINKKIAAFYEVNRSYGRRSIEKINI
ncbi:DUF3343 domain-containing protein [Alkaliphilus crotonatoxidans]